MYFLETFKTKQTTVVSADGLEIQKPGLFNRHKICSSSKMVKIIKTRQ